MEERGEGLRVDPMVRAVSNEEKATPAVMTFLREPRVGQSVSLSKRKVEDPGGRQREKRVEGGRDPRGSAHSLCPFLRLSFLRKCAGLRRDKVS